MKKGQIALEFLTTYGWAFLVILIMISTMTYFGIFNPSKLLPDRCNFGTEIECRDFQISWSGAKINLMLKNNLGKPIVISSMKAFTESATLSCDIPPFISGVWDTDIRHFTFRGCNLDEVGFSPGDKGKVFIKINYYSAKSGPQYTHSIYGEIFATVVTN